MKQKTWEEKRNIVILGGGFAGVRAALDLADYLCHDEEYEIILVDKKNYSLYHPALYEAATAEHGRVEAKKVKYAVSIPFSSIFSRTKVKVFRGYVEDIDFESGKIVTDSRVLSFDYLMAALGSVSDFYGIPNLEKYGFSLKSMEDAVMIRNRLCEVVVKNESASVVIAGGGFSGVEFAAEVYNLLKHEARHHNRVLKNFRITLVDGGTAFLSGLSEKVSEIVARRFLKLGIETKFSTLITDVGSDFVELNKKERMPADLLIWTGGVKSCRLPTSIDLERDKKDRIVVTSSLNLKKYFNVFLAGDNACITDPITKRPVPQTAQEAIRQGRHAAKNIFRLIHNRELLPYQPGSTRFIIPLGGKYAVLYTPNLILTGFLAWVLRRGADLRYFVSVLPFFKALKCWMSENWMFMKND